MSPGAIIVAGGRSSRYGQDKATLPWRGGTLLEHVIAQASAVAREVVVVGGPAVPGGGARRVDDLEAGGGPLQAVLAGARALPPGRHLVLACDLPYLEPPLLQRLVAPLGDSAARLPRLADRPQYLTGCYGPAAWSAFEARWAEGCRSLHGACRSLPILWLTAADLAAAGLSPRLLHDVDTPDDWVE